MDVDSLGRMLDETRISMDGTVQGLGSKLEETRIGMEALSARIQALESAGSQWTQAGGIQAVMSRISAVEATSTPQDAMKVVLGRIGGNENEAKEMKQELLLAQGRISAVEQTANGVVGNIAVKVEQIESMLGEVSRVEKDTRSKAELLYENTKTEFEKINKNADEALTKLEDGCRTLEQRTNGMQSKSDEVQKNIGLLEGECITRKAEFERFAIEAIAKVKEMDRMLQEVKDNPTTTLGINKKIEEIEERIKEGKAYKEKRPILENKAILDIPTLKDDKGEYHDWCEEMKNTLDNLRPGMGELLQWIEGLKDMEDREKEMKE